MRVTLGFGDRERVVLMEKDSSRITIVGSTSGWVDDE
jgi:hypothetical protein